MGSADEVLLRAHELPRRRGLLRVDVSTRCPFVRDGEFNRTIRDTFPQRNDSNLRDQAHREIINFAWTALVILDTAQPLEFV